MMHKGRNEGGNFSLSEGRVFVARLMLVGAAWQEGNLLGLGECSEGHRDQMEAIQACTYDLQSSPPTTLLLLCPEILDPSLSL